MPFQCRKEQRALPASPHPRARLEFLTHTRLGGCQRAGGGHAEEHDRRDQSRGAGTLLCLMASFGFHPCRKMLRETTIKPKHAVETGAEGITLIKQHLPLLSLQCSILPCRLLQAKVRDYLAAHWVLQHFGTHLTKPTSSSPQLLTSSRSGGASWAVADHLHSFAYAEQAPLRAPRCSSAWLVLAGGSSRQCRGEGTDRQCGPSSFPPSTATNEALTTRLQVLRSQRLPTFAVPCTMQHQYQPFILGVMLQMDSPAPWDCNSPSDWS